jgi:hypothetical protein
MFKLTGVIKVVNPTVQVSEKFKKREFVITDATSMYPQDIMFQLTQDKVDVLDSFMEGQSVEVSFSLKGREWTSPQGEVKYFNTLEAFRIENAGAQPVKSPTQQAAQQVTPQAASVADEDDVPF